MATVFTSTSCCSFAFISRFSRCICACLISSSIHIWSFCRRTSCCTSTSHSSPSKLCVAQIPSQELIRQTTCLNMQLQGCSQTHIHPDLVSPLPPNAIFLRRVVSTQGGTQGFYGLSAHENKDGQYVSISATNDGDHLPPPNYPHGSYLTPSPHHVPSSIMTNHLHSLSVPGQGQNDAPPRP